MGRMHCEVNLVAQKGSPVGHLARLENAGVRDRTPEGCHHQRAPARWLPKLGRATLAESVNSFRGVELCRRGGHRIDPAGNQLTVRYGLNPVRGDQSERCRGIEIDVQCREPGPIRLLCRLYGFIRRRRPHGDTYTKSPCKSRVFRLRRDRKLHLFHRTPLPSFGNWKSIRLRLDRSLISGKLLWNPGGYPNRGASEAGVRGIFWWLVVPIDFSVFLRART